MRGKCLKLNEVLGGFSASVDKERPGKVNSLSRTSGVAKLRKDNHLLFVSYQIINNARICKC